MMNKRLLLIVGSPKKDSTTAQMANCLRDEFDSKGWECHTLNLYEKNLQLCIGCRECRKSGICVIQDDVTEIRDYLLSCDIVALSAPTYFANVPGSVKNMFDRLSGVALDDQSRPKLKKDKKYILMSSCATKFPFDLILGQSTAVIRAMNEFFKMAGMSCHGKVVYTDAKSKRPLPTKIKIKIRRLVP